jgi:hypothetical protein
MGRSQLTISNDTGQKVFGVVPLTFLFAALQYPLLRRAREGGRAIVMD